MTSVIYITGVISLFNCIAKLTIRKFKLHKGLRFYAAVINMNLHRFNINFTI